MERSPSAQRDSQETFLPPVSRCEPRGRPQGVGGIIHVLPYGLHSRGCPAVHGPHKTLYNRFRRWSVRCLTLLFSELA
ncbi:MAG: transposase [Synechococcus sp. SB0668_bin_13]|nr:transposase [Synechococcus sp. SB0668_bin_13]